ncbi:glycoside hydrolase family 16 protein [Tortispora caseinolytica NRRL Y-17796]|uniref:Glycoside hydrolase family 16 protein n=1 Tax=Tortispora caseinolytica NRRL Y-17796 TaxID=767744 RepID=A0A1E4THH3_9ASCO|nr:glycoside hydrolase family 16 protein [Tortispora caseinolytica NRRL Y-17796]
MVLRLVLQLLILIVEVIAQASTSDCNPTISKCPSDIAFPEYIYADFREGPNPSFIQTGPGSVKYTDEGVELTISRLGQYPTLSSKGYFFFGEVTAVLKASIGQGIISFLMLMSDTKDEIDFEWFGSSSQRIQTNFFLQGAGSGYGRGMDHHIGDVHDEFHTYKVIWTETDMTFYIDGQLIRTEHAADPSGYPDTPMMARIGAWVGGDPSNPKGTVNWAGGETDFTEAPFTMTIQSIEIRNYTPGWGYKYEDTAGNRDSIRVLYRPERRPGARKAKQKALRKQRHRDEPIKEESDQFENQGNFMSGKEFQDYLRSKEHPSV